MIESDLLTTLFKMSIYRMYTHTHVLQALIKEYKAYAERIWRIVVRLFKVSNLQTVSIAIIQFAKRNLLARRLLPLIIFKKEQYRLLNFLWHKQYFLHTTVISPFKSVTKMINTFRSIFLRFMHISYYSSSATVQFTFDEELFGSFCRVSIFAHKINPCSKLSSAKDIRN